MSRRVEGQQTECGTSAPRAIVRSKGHCAMCPPWRGKQDLINGLCIHHLIWDMPARREKKKET